MTDDELATNITAILNAMDPLAKAFGYTIEPKYKSKDVLAAHAYICAIYNTSFQKAKKVRDLLTEAQWKSYTYLMGDEEELTEVILWKKESAMFRKQLMQGNPYFKKAKYVTQ